jgi:hypothetical protein
MGFSGITGTSDRAISALFHYGLAEKVVKGEIRITDLALSIMHPESDRERREALHEAGFSPQLFEELRRRYPGRPPASGTLESYLKREGFATAALKSATKAFLETCRFLQQEGAYESDGDVVEGAPESSVPTPIEEARRVQQVQIPSPTIASSHTREDALRQDIFTLEGGGYVTVALPEALSKREYEDLKDWLELMQRKAERKVAAQTSPTLAESTGTPLAGNSISDEIEDTLRED